MNCSYENVYQSYEKFCNTIGQPPLTFEHWMHAREAPEQPSGNVAQEANKILSLSEI